MERPPLELGDLVEHWTLVGDEGDLAAAKHHPQQQRDQRVGDLPCAAVHQGCQQRHRQFLAVVAQVRRGLHGRSAATDLTYYPAGETVPVHSGLSGDWADLAHRTDKRGRTRVIRTVYEIRTFEALCDQLKCKGVWVVGAMEFRDPDEDLPSDFGERRTEHYRALRKPLANRNAFGSTGTADNSVPFPQLRIVAVTARAGRAMLGAILGSSRAGSRPSSGAWPAAAPACSPAA